MKNNATKNKSVFPFSLYLMMSFLFTLMVSCDEQRNKRKWEYTLVTKDTLTIDLPTNTPEIALSPKWSYSNGILSFMSEQHNENLLFSYHFDQQKFHTYALAKLSKGLINQASSFAFLNDSILIYDQYFNSELLLLSLKTGQIKNTYPYDELYGISHHSTLKFYSDSLQFIFPFMYLIIEDPLYLERSKLALVIHKQNGESQLIGSYPQKIMINPEPRLKIIVPDMICQKEQIVINFRGEKDLYVYSIQQDTLHEYPCEDPGVYQLTNRKSSGDDFEDAIMEELQGLYKTLLYDEKFHRYYRISVSYPGFRGDIPSSHEEFEAIGKNRKVTVTVMDEHFNILTQNTLTEINENNSFIREGLLYMRRNLNSEDKMQFMGFDLVDI